MRLTTDTRQAQALCLEDFRQMEAIERGYYSEMYITPYKEAWQMYVCKPYTCFALKDPKGVAGFLNLFPVPHELYLCILDGSYNDAALTKRDVIPLDEQDTAPLYLFLSCIAIRSDRRGEGLADLLLKSALAYYRPYAKRFSSILMDTVTKDGGRFAERLGLSFLRDTQHASRLYGGAYQDSMGDRAIGQGVFVSASSQVQPISSETVPKV